MKRLIFTLSFPLMVVLTLLMVVCPVAMASQDTKPKYATETPAGINAPGA